MAVDFHNLIATFRRIAPAVDYWSLRLVHQEIDHLHMRQDRLQPPSRRISRGAHLTLVDRGGMGYAATCELNRDGLEAAIARATTWLECYRRHPLFPNARVPRPSQSGHYHTASEIPWSAWSLEDKIAMLADVNQHLRIHERIVDRQAWMSARRHEVALVTSDGVEVEQSFDTLAPGISAAANKGAETQIRTGGGAGAVAQGGLEVLGRFGFPGDADRIAEESLALLDAPQCPVATTSVLLMPNQMMLQIHESLGHPLELDRILGDERNMAGSSFIKPEMFGNFRYGSELLNVTFDPVVPGEAASYQFDDAGTPAERQYLIQGGILLRPLGGSLSQARAGLSGAACSRASDWNRAPIDRMGNINIEPGDSSFQDLIGSVERGILMDTNRSWSIDDQRNKFQFSCELGHLIENGELKGMVRNPNYRGVSRHFWRDLAGVGDAASREVWGTFNCGKGEPNQLMYVGHASPPCLFHNVEVFGGE